MTILGDTVQELNETFLVTLSSPSAGLELGDAVAVGTILNDDIPPNQLPTAVVTATPTSGFGPLAVNFTGSGSYDQDGSIVSYAWTFGDGASSSAQNPSRTYSTPGTYTATLTVTDNRGGTGTASTQIVVSQNQALVMHVASITMALVQGASGTSARATVRIVNGNGQPVQGATVSGNWTGLAKSTSTATTDANGNAVLTSKASRKNGNVHDCCHRRDALRLHLQRKCQRGDDDIDRRALDQRFSIRRRAEALASADTRTLTASARLRRVRRSFMRRRKRALYGETQIALVAGTWTVKRSCRELAVIEPRRLVEHPQRRRQVDWRTPLIGTSSCRDHADGQSVPPWRDAASDWLDDQNPRASTDGVEEPCLE